MNRAAYGNGISENWTYDAAYRPTNITDALSGASLQNLTYGYDNANNVLSIADAVNPADSQTFSYDTINQLTGAVSGTNGYGSFGWTYDKVGNRLTQMQGLTTTTYGYTNGTNRLASITVSTSSAQLRTLSVKNSPMAVAVALHSQTHARALPVHRVSELEPNRQSSRSAILFISVLGWPLLVIGVGGTIRFRKRLGAGLFIGALCFAALVSGMLWLGRPTVIGAAATVKVATPSFSPAVGQIRSTRSLPTRQPARLSSAVIRRYP
jgi:hypothetical protein